MSQSNSHRMEKVERELRALSSQFFLQGGKRLGDALLTVSRVWVSKDIRHAKVYISLLSVGEDEIEEDFEELKEMEGELGRFVGRQMTTKYTPKISLILDDSQEEVEKIHRKLGEIRKGDQ